MTLPMATRRNAVSVGLSQTIFGQVEQLPLQMTKDHGWVEIEGVLPGHYDVTVTHFVPGQGRRRGQSTLKPTSPPA